jgi:hypothetical protein
MREKVLSIFDCDITAARVRCVGSDRARGKTQQHIEAAFRRGDAMLAVRIEA